MCGIIGMASAEPFSVKKDLLSLLKRLEYRGYDSAGWATSSMKSDKKVGYIDRLIAATGNIKTRTAIAHTRWATHGGVTRKNAHPHSNKDKTLFAIHNGIIENFKEMKEKLTKRGYRFITETDSEIIPHYFDHWLGKLPMKEVMQKFMKEAKGTFAILILRKDDERIYAMKRDSPLVMGILQGRRIVASDIYAFSDSTDQAIFFEDDEGAIISADRARFFTADGKGKRKKAVTIPQTEAEESKENYPHYMIKEVKEQPVAAKRLLTSLRTVQRPHFMKLIDLIRKAGRVVFVACGTSYHATLVGVYLLKKQGIKAHTVIASEFENFLWVDKKTLVIAVTQSGETMDVLTVLKDVKQKGCAIASIVNVPYSTVQRMSTVSLEVCAGQEICVAATKSFTNQVITMLAIGDAMGYRLDLRSVPDKIRKTISMNESKVRRIAKQLKAEKDIFVLGRGLSYPIAREIALKLKEIPYIHAEGMMGGELKHGTIALIEKGTPVISLIPDNNSEMRANTQEVKARGARVLIIANREDQDDADLVVPWSDDAEFSIYACIVGHLLAYYIAKENGLPIDKPRNLAKSVTV
ncbi:MAG: glutamine--fructose-6-phosphate transaminase (isomerizing), partial [DPANN group archaeon]|nr:glutamine--fructose-6-phosphate transaminase (isomerizing) [DPANN group archaeon]